MIGVIYKYTSPSGKIYVGQTINPKERYRKHVVCNGKRKTAGGYHWKYKTI